MAQVKTTVFSVTDIMHRGVPGGTRERHETTECGDCDRMVPCLLHFMTDGHTRRCGTGPANNK